MAVEDSPDDCQMKLIDLLTWTPRGVILKIAWWTFTNSMFADGFPICLVMQEKLSPSFVDPTAVSYSF